MSEAPTENLRLRVYVHANSFLIEKPHHWNELSAEEKEQWVYEAAEEAGKLETSYAEVPRV